MLKSPIGDCTIDYTVALSLSLTTICSSHTAVAAAFYVNTTVSDTAATAYLLAVKKRCRQLVILPPLQYHTTISIPLCTRLHETAVYTESATVNTTNCCYF